MLFDRCTLSPRLKSYLRTALCWPVWRPGRAFNALCGLLFLAGFLRFFSPFEPGSEVPHGHEAVRVARNLAAGHGFVSPFAGGDTGPTAHVSPVYPYFQATLWRIFGVGPAGKFVFENSAAVMVALQVALLPMLARAFGMHASAGLIASIMMLIGAQTHPDWEANYVAVLVMLVSWGMVVLLLEEAPRLRVTALISLLWGVLVLANPSALLPYFIWLSWWEFSSFSRHGLQGTKRATSLLIMIAFPALLTMSWTYRNHVVFGQWVFLRSNLGLELSVSNNSCAEYGISANLRIGCFQESHPNISVEEAQQLAVLGEPAYNQVKLRNALEWIRHHPRRFVTLSLQRLWFFWFPSANANNIEGLLRSRSRLIVYSATLVSIPGLLLLYASNRTPSVIFLLWLGCFPLLHYLVQFSARYRAPILWLTFLLAGFATISLLQRLVGDSGSVESVPGEG